MKLRAKSTTLSHRAPVYYVDLTIRDGLTLEGAITEAKAFSERRKQLGHDQDALDEAAKCGFASGAFEEGEDDIPEIVEEFFGVNETDGSGLRNTSSSTKSNLKLSDKLEQKVTTSIPT